MGGFKNLTNIVKFNNKMTCLVQLEWRGVQIQVVSLVVKLDTMNKYNKCNKLNTYNTNYTFLLQFIQYVLSQQKILNNLTMILLVVRLSSNLTKVQSPIFTPFRVVFLWMIQLNISPCLSFGYQYFFPYSLRSITLKFFL